MMKKIIVGLFVLFFLFAGVDKAMSEPCIICTAACGNNWQIYEDTIWDECPVYIVEASVSIYNGATLTIPEGTVVKFDPGEYPPQRFIQVASNLQEGTLIANGVVFTSLYDDDPDAGGDTNGDGDATTPSPGDWKWIIFQQDSSGSLDNCTFRYGNDGAVYCHYGSPSNISNCTFEYTGGGTFLGHGLRCGQFTAPSVIKDNTFIGNHKCGISIYAPYASNIGTGNKFNNVDNTYDGNNCVEVTGGTIASGDHTWNPLLIDPAPESPAPDHPYNRDTYVPYVLSLNVTIAGATLTLDPNVFVKMETNFINVGNNGVFITDGDLCEDVIITSYEDDSVGGDTNNDDDPETPGEGTAGNWQSIKFNDGSDGHFEHTIISYATDGIYCFQGCFSDDVDRGFGIENCIMHNCLNKAVFVRWDEADATIANSIFYNNGTAIHLADWASQSIIIGNLAGLSNCFYDNTLAVDNIYSNHCVPANYNYWGDNAGPYDDSSPVDECGLTDNIATNGDEVDDDVGYSDWVFSNDSPPPVGDGDYAGGVCATMTHDGNEMDYEFDNITCDEDTVAVVLYGNIGDYTTYVGVADCDGYAGVGDFDATTDLSPPASDPDNVWYNVVWVNASHIAGHPGYDNLDSARDWTAKCEFGCGIIGDDHTDPDCD